MSNKSKGSNAERELYQMFVDNHYRAVRVAGSGTMENADCDIIAGKKGKKFAVEAKSCKKLPKYITKDQVNRFITFSEIFGLKPVIAVRINRIGWIFLNPKEMEDSGKNWVVNEDIIKKKGTKFSQFFGEKIKPNNAIPDDKTLKISEDIIIDEKELDSLTGADYSDSN
ncbi:MAG: Holliday junction resolvase Hjc [Candidatus Pacearchaeota archaeon]|jgi:Holliday junction resolvase